MLGDPEPLEVAVRAHAVPDSAKPGSATHQARSTGIGPSEWTLTFDTETTLDTGQSLRVGAYQLRRRSRLREEGLFYDAEGLSDAERQTLSGYAATHGLALRQREEFNDDVFLKTAWDRRGVIVGHNLPFDLAVIAIDHGPCQSKDRAMRGGFSHTISADEHKSHVQVKRINAGAAFIRLTIPSGIHPEERNRDRGGRTPNHHGYFIDTATLGGAMLGGRPALKHLACLLRTPHQKGDADHGEVLTAEYVDYLRLDVQVTYECWQALEDRYNAYGLAKGAWEIYSEASIGKAHLDKTGLTPFLAINHWPGSVLATVMETYYGGRAECAIRRTPIPGMYVDFTSQYPTSYILQNLKRYLIADRVDYHHEGPAVVQALLDRVTVYDVLKPECWLTLDALVLVAPDADRLPTRARYARTGGRPGSKRNRALNVGLPYRSGGPAQWLTLADCIDSKLETDKAPRVLKVLRFSPTGVQDGLRAIDVAGQEAYRVDPVNDDLIRRLVELRAAVRTRQKVAEDDGDHGLASQLDAIQQAMKAIANSTAYGSPIELNPIEHRKPEWVTVHLPDATSYRVQVDRTEQPGRWFHPLIATLVAGGGRLMLGAAMRLVADLGGHYVFCDTDSLFIAATEKGGLIPCRGGPHRTANGSSAVLTLSWEKGHEVVQRFATLNPYETIPGSILKIEKENYDPDTGQQREIECFSIAAKRYGLFTRAPDGRPILVSSGSKLKRSEHGLGHLLPPHAKSPNIDDRAWLDDWWQHLLCVELGYPSNPPAWFEEPAVGRLTVTSTRDLKHWKTYNAGRPRSEQVKPANFLIMAHPTDRERARHDGPRCLVAPFERDPVKRLSMLWADRDRPGNPPRRIRTDDPHEYRTNSVTVLSYGDYFDNYRQHPEAKALDATDGRPCHTWTRGLLEPWHVEARVVQRVGKESNRLTDTHLPAEDPDEQLIEYPSSTRACRGCATIVMGRMRWCTEACRKRSQRRTSRPRPAGPT